MKLRLGLLVILLAAALTGCTQVNSSPYQEAKPNISVQGQGKVTAQPDEATVHFGIVSEDKSLQKAYKDSTSKMNAIIQTVKKMGVQDKDIKTSSFDISPLYALTEHGQQKPNEIIGFAVRQQLTVLIRDLSKTGDLIDRVIGSGTNVFSGIEFSSSRFEALAAEARAKAARAAAENAKALAKNLNVKLGRLLNASDSYSIPYQAPRAMYMKADMMAMSAPQIQAGSMEIIANCNAVYEVRQ